MRAATASSRRRTAPAMARGSVLTAATPRQLAEAVQRNQAEWIRFEGHLPDVELHPEPDVTWIASSTPGRPNTVALARFDPAGVQARIGAILARYRQLDVSTVWWVGPMSEPDDLAYHLRAAGFHCFKHFPGLAMDLGRIPRVCRRLDGLSCSQVTDFSIFHRQEHPFFGPVTTERRRNLVEGERLLCAVRPQRAFSFVATFGGEALGHAMLFTGAGVAGLYDVGVVRRARGCGVGKAITLAALHHAKKLGYRYAILQASGDGEHLYRKLGFIEACRLSLWFHSRRHHNSPASR